MTRRLLLLPLLCAAALAGCGHVPVSTMWALRSFDATTVDPAQLRAAIRIPDTLEPQPGGVTLNIGWRREGGAPHEAKFILKETTDAADLAPLAAEKRPGTRIHAFRVELADIPKIKALQAQAIEEKARGGGKTHGSFGVGAEACRRGDLADGPLPMTTFLRVEEQGPYLTVLKNVDLRSLVTKEKSLDALVPACGG
ncbi:hypothetical protein V3H18_08425 [Methylocystis sp. 9N]|uniref:Lipoprotein n=1 Tax=Methylocystis borbori TaxID=3118750 RepID=A0ABU7XGP7_9HYPH